MLLNNECATYLENVPQQIFQSNKQGFQRRVFTPLCILFKSFNLKVNGTTNDKVK